MTLSGYLKTLLLILLIMAPLQAEAGTWGYRCILFSDVVSSCYAIGTMASLSVSDAFISKYPHEKYAVFFTVDTHEDSNGFFFYLVVASLHARNGRWLRFPEISGHSSYGFYVKKASFAIRWNLVMEAVEVATEKLVSDVTGR